MMSDVRCVLIAANGKSVGERTVAELPQAIPVPIGNLKDMTLQEVLFKNTGERDSEGRVIFAEARTEYTRQYGPYFARLSFDGDVSWPLSVNDERGYVLTHPVVPPAIIANDLDGAQRQVDALIGSRLNVSPSGEWTRRAG